jgi:hypothetical protein
MSYISHLKIIFLFFILISKLSFAQESKGAAGLRFGYGWGLSGKMFLDRNGNALEFTLKQGMHGSLYNTNFVNLATTYQKHFEIDRRGKWFFYAGGGAALGFGKNTSEQRIISTGILPIIGLDFWTQNLVVPFNLSFDYSPGIYYDRTTKVKKNDVNIGYFNFNIAVRVGLGRL